MQLQQFVWTICLKIHSDVRHTYDEDTNHRFVVSSDETFLECECTLERSDVAYTVNYSCTDISVGQT